MALKKLCVLLSALLLLSGCAPVSLRAESPAPPAASGRGLNMGEAEIQETLASITSGIPKSETTGITLTPLPQDSLQDGTEDNITLYQAEIGITWDARLGRFSVEKALDEYSRTLAVNVMSGAPPVVLLDVAWTIPFHDETEAAMRYSFERNRNAVWQTGLYDRFTDGSFGADAFLETPVNPVPASVKIDAAPVASLSDEPVSPFSPSLPPTAEQAVIVKSPRTEIS